MLLKVLGIWIFVEGLYSFISIGLSWFVMTQYQPVPTIRFTEQWWLSIEPIAAPVVQMVIGIYLFFGGAWVANRAFPSNRPYCAECGYDLRGSAERCPECGAAVPKFQDRRAGDELNDLKSEI